MEHEMPDDNQVTQNPERTFGKTASERQCRYNEEYGYHENDEE